MKLFSMLQKPTSGPIRGIGTYEGIYTPKRCQT